MDDPSLAPLPVYGFAPNLGGLIGLLIIVVLPLIVGLLTKQSWSAGTKGLVLLALAAIKSILEAWLAAVNTTASFAVVPVIYTTVINFLIAVAVHFGLLRNTSVGRKAQNSGNVDGPATAYPDGANRGEQRPAGPT